MGRFQDTKLNPILETTFFLSSVRPYGSLKDE